MTDVENTELLLQYMRIVVRQQDGILEALNGMRRQNDNLSAILAQELARRRINNASEEQNRINRTRTRPFFASTILPQVRERRPHPIVTHHRTRNTTIL